MRTTAGRRGAVRASKRTAVAACVLAAITVFAIMSRGTFEHTFAQLRTVSRPSWPPLALAVFAVIASYWLSALGLRLATGSRLPLGRTTLVQLAAATANRFTPGSVGGAAVNARYLMSEGLSAGAAAAAISLTGVAHVGVAVLGVLVVAPALGRLPFAKAMLAWRLGGIPIVVVACVAVVIVGVFGLRALRTRHASRGPGRLAGVARDARTALAQVARHPWRLLGLLTATAGVKLATMLALFATMAAFDGDIGDWRIASIYLVGMPAAEAIPTPGGVGTVDAVLIAGLTHAAGGTVGAVVAAVVVFRLLTFWAPIVPGALASGSLRRRRAPEAASMVS